MQKMVIGRSGDAIDPEDFAKKLDSGISKFENVIWNLINFDSDRSILSQVYQTPWFNYRGKLKKVEEIHVEEVVLPLIDVCEEDNYITVAGLGFIMLKSGNLEVCKDSSRNTYLRYGDVVYPLAPPSIESSFLVLLNKDSRLVDLLPNYVSVTKNEIEHYLVKSVAEARNFYNSLKQREDEFKTYYFATGYKSYVEIVDIEDRSHIKFEYYNIGSDVWKYFGINRLYTDNPAKFFELITKNGSRRTLLDISYVIKVLSKIDMMLSASYIFTKIMKNVLEE